MERVGFILRIILTHDSLICKCLVVARGLVCSCDPTSYAGGDFVGPGRFYRAGQVVGEGPDEIYIPYTCTSSVVAYSQDVFKTATNLNSVLLVENLPEKSMGSPDQRLQQLLHSTDMADA